MTKKGLETEELRAQISSVAFEQASTAIKSILLFNGGGVVSILAFIGSSGFSSLNIDLERIKLAFMAFSIGAFLSLLTAFASFFASAMHAHYLLNEGYDRSYAIRITGCIMAVVAIVCFLIGAMSAIAGISPRA